MKDKDTINFNNGTIKELADQAKNTKSIMDRLNKAYIGLTTDELIRLALSRDEKEGENNENND